MKLGARRRLVRFIYTQSFPPVNLRRAWYQADATPTASMLKGVLRELDDLHVTRLTTSYSLDARLTQADRY